MKIILSNQNSVSFENGQIKLAKKRESVLYTAVILDDASKAKLKTRFPLAHPNEFVHHMTIKFERGQDLPENLGETVSLQVVGYQEDSNGQAVVINPPSSLNVVNKIPHVTMSTATDVKPKYSNDMLAEGYLKIDSFNISGQVVAITTKQTEITSKEQFESLQEEKVKEEVFPYTPQSEGYIIYCDMDGVITDFDKAFIEYYHKDFRNSSSYLKKPEDFPEVPAARTAKDIQDVIGNKKYIVTNSAPVEFWSKMVWLPDGKQLWNSIKDLNPIILSTPASSSASTTGKKTWVKSKLGATDLILSDKKHAYLSNNKYVAKEDLGKNKILIDDKSENISNWKQNGGIGILHTSADNTISKLKKLGVI